MAQSSRSIPRERLELCARRDQAAAQRQEQDLLALTLLALTATAGHLVPPMADEALKPPWRASVLTLFPELFPGPLGASVLGRGLKQGLWDLETVDIRDFSDNRYGSVDAPPAGGGAGLVMRADILAAALDSVPKCHRPVLCLTPRGRPFDQARAASLAREPGVIALCGRFEGIDDRLIEARGIEEVSIGDFVLAGGEIGAMALIEACVRLLPGLLGSPHSLGEESFASGDGPDAGVLLEYPQYAKPRVFEGRPIPDVLLSGDHKKIAEWRRAQAEETTRTRRPDLWERHQASGPIRREKNKD